MNYYLGGVCYKSGEIKTWTAPIFSNRVSDSGNSNFFPETYLI
jgi:hypothetical protein